MDLDPTLYRKKPDPDTTIKENRIWILPDKIILKSNIWNILILFEHHIFNKKNKLATVKGELDPDPSVQSKSGPGFDHQSRIRRMCYRMQSVTKSNTI